MARRERLSGGITLQNVLLIYLKRPRHRRLLVRREGEGGEVSGCEIEEEFETRGFR